MKSVVFVSSFLLSVLSVLAAGPGFCAEASLKVLRYEELAAKAVESPSVLSLKKEYEAHKGKVFGALLPEDPEFGVDAEGQPEFLKIGDRQNLEYSVTQSTPFPTKLITRAVIASQEAQIARQRWKAAEREATRDAARLFQELAVVERTTTLLESHLVVLEDVLRSVSARYGTLPAADEDALKTRIELDRAGIEVFGLKEKRRTLEARIARLLGDPLAQSYAVETGEAESVRFAAAKELQAKAETSRFELAMLKTMLDKARSERSLSRQDLLPDVTLRYEGRTSGPSGSIDEHDAFIGLSVPIGSFLKGAGGGWSGADADVEAAEAAYLNMRQEVYIEVLDAYGRWRSADHALRVHQSSILPQADRQLELARSSYVSGRRDFLGVMDAIRTQREAHVSYFQAQGDYETSAADLNYATGP